MDRLWLLLVFLTACISASSISVMNGAHHRRESPVIAQIRNDFTFEANAQCFAQRQVHDIQLKPISYMDCLKAAEKATFGGKAGAPMHFSRDPGVGMRMPASWAHGSCVIRIDTREPKDDDSFPMFDVANAASLIAERCTKRDTPGLGGLGLIGPKKVIMIFVYGRIPGPPPKPRPTVPPAANAA